MAQRERLSFELPRAVHVECSGPEQPQGILIAYHGYAQSPLQLLDALEAAGICERHLVVAPWGLHQFYDRKGEVVASWMTRLERERSIEELCEHARRLWTRLLARYGGLPLSLFGFSQGASNAYRVGLLAGLPVRRIHVLAGDLPPELRERLAEFAGPPVQLLWGTEDRRVGAEILARDRGLLEAAGFPHRVTQVAGGHELLPGLLAELARQLDRER